MRVVLRVKIKFQGVKIEKIEFGEIESFIGGKNEILGVNIKKIRIMRATLQTNMKF